MNTKICEWRCCNKEFIPTKSTQRFCKKNCAGAQNVHIKRARHKQKAVAYLGGKCSVCNYNKSLNALDFHHLRDKEHLISQLIAKNKSWTIIKIELEKCILLCANCHREEHDIYLSEFQIE